MWIESDLIHTQVPAIQQTKPIKHVILHVNMFVSFRLCCKMDVLLRYVDCRRRFLLLIVCQIHFSQ